MERQYDVVVVGGGPAGSMAALHAARSGVSVLLLEKDRDIGYPVRCGEAVSEEGLKQFVDVKSSWIASIIDEVRFVSPSGMEVLANSPANGYILNRRIFDYDLAMLASREGATILTKAYVYGLLMNDKGVEGVRARIMNEEHEIRAKIVIAADGVESRVSRWAGFRTQVKLKDIESCVQATVSNIDIPENRIDFYLAKKWAPGGYLWVFPKGSSIANIGLGIMGTYASQKSAREFLREFIESHYPGASILTYVAGGVPCSSPMKRNTADRFMIVGDAAHQVNPMTGGGIISGMKGGEIAGKVAAQAIKENNLSEERLSEYTKEWFRIVGKDHERFYRLKEVISKFEDQELDEIAAKLQGIPPEKITLTKIFKTALIRHPSLIIDVIKVFAGL